MKTNRDLTEQECYQKGGLPKGTIIFEYFGCTYGCCDNSELPCTLVEDKTPFFGVPKDAIDYEL